MVNGWIEWRIASQSEVSQQLSVRKKAKGEGPRRVRHINGSWRRQGNFDFDSTPLPRRRVIRCACCAKSQSVSWLFCEALASGCILMMCFLLDPFGVLFATRTYNAAAASLEYLLWARMVCKKWKKLT